MMLSVNSNPSRINELLPTAPMMSTTSAQPLALIASDLEEPLGSHIPLEGLFGVSL